MGEERVEINAVAADGTVYQRVLSAPRIAIQVFEGEPPRRAMIQFYDADGNHFRTLWVDQQWVDYHPSAKNREAVHAGR